MIETLIQVSIYFLKSMTKSGKTQKLNSHISQCQNNKV